jgi:hypothetical protein
MFAPSAAKRKRRVKEALFFMDQLFAARIVARKTIRKERTCASFVR